MNHAILRNAAMLRTPPHQLLRSLRRQAPAASASASASTFRPAAVVMVPSFPVRHFSITYSGGQASEGQGGFYGSGGSRKNTNVIEHHPEALGDMEDIQTLMKVMEGVEKLEEKLAESMAAHGSSINEESIELKAAIKRKMSSAKMALLLDRLEINGQPRWGLSSDERVLVQTAREKYNLS